MKDTAVTVDNLKCGSRYKFRITAHNEKCVGEAVETSVIHIQEDSG